MNGSLINKLIQQKYLKSPLTIEAFRKIKRADFAPKEVIKNQGEDFVAEYNAPISIGYNQTISQPQTVAFMLELLKPQRGDRVLDIGSGSGWQTAMLCDIVGQNGFVYAVEIVQQLKEFGEKNVAKYNFRNVEFICGDASGGLIDKAPFGKIIAAAASDHVIPSWRKQLKIDGRLVVPILNSIWLIIKKGEDEFEEKEYPGFAFVPLIGGK